MFDPLDTHTDDDWAALRVAAELYCAGCPALQACSDFASAARHTGLYGGVYRYRRKGRYAWRVLSPGASAPQVADRRNGVRVGWDVA